MALHGTKDTRRKERESCNGKEDYICPIVWFKHVLAYKEHALSLWVFGMGKSSMYLVLKLREIERNFLINY